MRQLGISTVNDVELALELHFLHRESDKLTRLDLGLRCQLWYKSYADASLDELLDGFE